MNKKILIALCSALLIFGCYNTAISQIVCPTINAQFGTGPSTTICNGNCATLSASVVPVNQTTSYSVQSIPYTGSFPYTGGTTAISGFDDQWSSVINIGFNFCYYGNTYSQCVVGSNGQITFGLGNAGAYNNWSISTALPNTVDMPGNTICGVFRDIDATSTGQASYYVTGTAPCRALVVYWKNVPLFSCGTPHSFTQIVLYESTNLIDVNIQNSTTCAGWNSGYGIVGVQNASGTIGTAAPGRNVPAAWTATNESWRFVPTGAVSYTVNWAGPSGPVGTGTSVVVCPTATSNYTATMTTGSCASANTYTSTVQVIVTPGPTLAVNSATICQGQSATLNVSGASSYTWTPSGSNAASVTFTPATTTVYTVQGKNGSCISTATTAITVNPLPTVTASNSGPLCSGSTLTLSAAPAAASYTWTGPNSFSSNAQNPTIAPITTLAAGVYTVKVSSAAGCTATATTTVSITPNPTISATNNSPVCAGTSFTLFGGGGGTYSWTGPNAFSSAAQNPVVTNPSTSASGTYSLLVSIGTCTASATTSVTINPLPTVNPSNTGPYCPGATIQLNVTPAASSYTWSGPSGFSSNAQNPTQGPATTAMGGVYTVSVTNALGCVNYSTTTVVVNPNPAPTIGSNSPVCFGNSINLTSGGGGTYSWSGPSAFSSTLQNPTIAGATAAMAGVYTVTVTSAAGCTATANVNVSVTTPTVSAGNTGPYCANATIQLNSSAATSYTWSGPSAFSSNAQNPTRPTATPAMSGMYTVVATVGGCTVAATTSVTVNALPTPAATNTGPYCPGATIQLNVTPAASSYTWSGPSAFSSNAQNPTQGPATAAMAGVYTVSVTNAQGCVNFTTTTVVVNPNPTPTIGSNSPVCLGSSINLTSGGGSTYNWSGPNSFSSTLQNPTIAASTAAMAGVYTVTVTSAAGCTSTTSINVTVTTPTTSASNTGPYCANATIQLNAPAASSYTWSGPAAFSSNAQNPTRPTATPAMSGTYTVLVTIGTCTATATTSVTVNPLPTPTVSNTGPYCPGNTIQLNGSSAVSYTWSGPSAFSSNAQNPTQGPATTAMGGVYSFSVSDVNGCVNFTTTTVVVNPTPVPVIGSNSPVCLNNTINLTASGGSSYAWSGPNAFASALQNPSIPAATTINAGVYTVTVTALGCSATNTVNVIVTTPTTSASNTGPYCANATIQLNAPAASSYTWSGPAAFSSNAQNPTRPSATVGMSGTYTVLVTIGTCTATATTSVTVNPLPTPTVSNTGPYCPGNTIQLNGSSAVSYTWSGPSAFSSNAQNPTQGPATTAMGGVYSFSVSDVNGCVNFTTTTVVVNPTPVPVIGSNSPVCVNTTINLTASGGSSYAWSGPNAFASALQNPSIPAATTINAGVYTVTVTALGCSATNTVNVSVLTPSTTASNTGPYCANATIQLNTPAATSYTWSGPAAFSSNAQNPTRPSATVGMSGTYTVIVSIGTCTALATTSVTVNALPTPTVSSNSPVCVGNPITFSGSAASSYSWSGPAGFTSNIQSPVISTAGTVNAGVYGYTVTDVNGCVNFTSTSVVVNPLPVITLNSPTVCLNQAINLTASGGVGYFWAGPNSFTSTAQNPTIPSAVMANNGTYTVGVTSAAGCTNIAVTNVTVKPLPTPAITSNTPCVGGTLNLSGSGATTYTWSGPNTFSSTLQNPNITNVTMAANGVYTLLGATGSCTASVTASITIHPLPTPNIITNSPVCLNNPILFAGTGGVSYSWSGPAGFTASTATTTIPAAATANGGSYSLTVTDANGCVNSTSANVVVNPLPLATAMGTLSCQNANATLAAGGGVSYNWSGPAAFSSVAQNPTITNAQMSNAGQYTVIVTGANTCSSSAVASLTVTPAPVPSIVTNAPICINNVLSFSGSGGTSYAWSGPNGFFSAAQNPTVLANSTAFTGNYNLTVTDANGCSASTTQSAVVNPIPTIFVVASNNKGCAPLCVTFTVSSSSPVQQYTWNMGDGTTASTSSAVACYGTTGVYTTAVMVSDVNGCTNSTTHTVQIYPQPVADFNYAPIKPIEGVDEVEFTDASYNGNITSWNWYFMSTAQYTSTDQNPSFLYTDAGQYAIALIVKNDQGCTDTVVKSIVVGEDFGIWVPNAFTPNGDGLNDIFYAKGYGITKFNMDIFDRWGEKVFSATDINDAWDGIYQHRGQNTIEEGVYTWQIRVTNVFGKAKELSGHVTLIK